MKVTYDPIGVTKTWNGPNICGDYKGFVCAVVPDTNQKPSQASINFNNFHLDGPNLTNADFLMGLPDLYELDLSNNKFLGNFPSQVLRANKLLLLDLRFNRFTGVVPPEIFNLNLDILFINNNNNFIQKLPDNLGSTTAKYLTLANNKFIGRIPPSIGQAKNTLLEVDFLNNQLTGCLRYEIRLLKKATVLNVGFNYLTGPIPHSFQCLGKMELAHNKFYGVVQEAVCSLPELFNLTLSHNYFTQVGPKCQELIKNGVVEVKMNCILDLPNQRSSADCARFLSTTHSCPNEKPLTYVPCSEVHTQAQLEASDVRLTALPHEPVQTSLKRCYGALFPNYVVNITGVYN